MNGITLINATHNILYPILVIAIFLRMVSIGKYKHFFDHLQNPVFVLRVTGIL